MRPASLDTHNSPTLDLLARSSAHLAPDSPGGAEAFDCILDGRVRGQEPDRQRAEYDATHPNWGDQPPSLAPSDEPIPITRATGKKKKKGRPPDELSPDTRVLPPPTNPMAVAREFVAEHMYHGTLTLRHWRGGWWAWASSRWVEREGRSVRAEAYRFTENAYFAENGLAGLLAAIGETPDIGDLAPWEPTKFKIGNLLDATAAIAHLEEEIDQPSWIGVDGVPVVAVANGLLRLEGRILLPHTPANFNQTSVPFDFDPAAPEPAAWLR